MNTLIKHAYIVENKDICNGEPIVQGTKTTVRAIVELWRLGISPEEITQHLPHLTLAQIFDALSYYSEQTEAINEYIIQNRIPDQLIHPALKEIRE